MSDNNLKEVSSNKFLSFFAYSALIIGIIAGVILIGVAGTINNASDYEMIGANGFDWLFLSLGIVCLIQGVFFFALLKGFSDIVLLLKIIASNKP